jgi:Flp pilus assembly protein TadD
VVDTVVRRAALPDLCAHSARQPSGRQGPDAKEGIAHLEQAVSLKPDDTHFDYELGLAYREAAMQDRAKEELALSAKLYGTKAVGEPK